MCQFGIFALLAPKTTAPHHGGMHKKEFDEQCADVLLTKIDDLLRKRLDLIRDLIEVLARGIIRIERQLDQPQREERPSA